MPERPRILYTIESMVGFRIREEELSIPIQERVVQLMRMERRLDNLRDEVVALNRRRRNLLLFVFVSCAVAVVGIIFGLTGVIRNYLTGLQAALSIWGAIGVFIVDYSIIIFAIRLQSIVRQNNSLIARVSVALDAGLETLSHEVLQEPPRTRLPLD